MNLDFEDNFGAELPFIRTNPLEAELQPIIDETTDNMPFEMSELLSADEGDYLDDAEELGLSTSFRARGSIGTGGITGRARGSVSTPKKTSAKKKSAAQIRAEFRRKRQRKIEAAKKAARIKARAAKRKAKPRPKPTWSGVRLAPGAKVPGLIAAKPTVRQLHREIHKLPPRPAKIVELAPTRLATAGVTCGCAQMGRIEKLLKKAATQRVATSEHKTLINQKKFRTRTIGQLRAILGRLNYKDRSRVIRAACGMGGA